MALVDVDKQDEAEEEEIPSASVVASLKAKHADRVLQRVEMRADDGSRFIMVVSGPNKYEWKKYQQEIAKADKDPEKLEQAVTVNAKAQIRWPDRDAVNEMFERNPGLWANFPDVLNKLARVEVEVTTKKL